MIAIISLLVVMIFSMLITRIATIALTLTGLSRESARFQARSAFTGVGYSTHESEKVVNHPVRRRILMLLMLIGNAGIVTAMASITLAFLGDTRSGTWIWQVILLFSGLGILWIIANSSWVDRRLSPIISLALKRWGQLDVRDYAAVLHLSGDYGVIEIQVNSQDWLANKTLAELNLSQEGILVLGVKRPDGTYLGAPKGPTCIRDNDILIMYGRSPVLAELDRRDAGWRGDVAHKQSVNEQKQVFAEQHRNDPVQKDTMEGTDTTMQNS